jgi:predicted nucleotide-binding protein
MAEVFDDSLDGLDADLHRQALYQGQYRDAAQRVTRTIRPTSVSMKRRLQKTKGSFGPTPGKRVFLVHGHDIAMRESTARVLERLGLEPIVVDEQPSSGRTIIEQVDEYGGVAFAVVLLTPDDVGCLGNAEVPLSPRARQNVIFELGYFAGRLGRTHVAALLREEIERPSDHDGVVYIRFDNAGAWKLRLAKELKAAGLDVNFNDLT